MLKKVFHRRNLWPTVIVIALLLIVLLLPFPIGRERLTYTRWCAPSAYNAHFQFAEMGKVQYGTNIPGSFDGTSLWGHGNWAFNGKSLRIVVEASNFHDEGYVFSIRPILFGYAFWSTADWGYGEDTIILPVWRVC